MRVAAHEGTRGHGAVGAAGRIAALLVLRVQGLLAVGSSARCEADRQGTGKGRVNAIDNHLVGVQLCPLFTAY